MTEHPLSESAERALAHLRHLLLNGFTGTLTIECHEGGVRRAEQRQILASIDMMHEQDDPHTMKSLRRRPRRPAEP